MSVSERLFMIMDSQKLRAIDLASVLHINASVISMWKKRNTSPPTDYLLQICGFLGVTVNFLLTGEPEAESEVPFTERYIPPHNGLPEDERDILAMYTLMSEEGKRIAYFSLKGIVEGTTNLGYSRQYGAKDESGKTA